MFPAEPKLVELGGVLFGNAAALQMAIEDGADAVVSMCRMGTHDVPTGFEHHGMDAPVALDVASRSPNVRKPFLRASVQLLG